MGWEDMQNLHETVMLQKPLAKMLFCQGVAGGARNIHQESERQNQFDANTQ